MSAKHSSGTRPRHILLGVTGSIAAFKACQLASNLTKHGREVRVMMTASATKFVGPVTFDSLTHTATRTAMFPAAEYATYTDEFGEARVGVSHIEDAKWADIVVIAPATANVIAKFASGIADDYLTSTTLAATCPKLVCPAMNVHMYENPATQRNIAECRELGFRFVDPTSGLLACQDVGKGRLAEPEDIEQAIDALLDETLGAVEGPDANDNAATTDADTVDNATESLPLAGLNVLITAGPTQEPLDPIRYLTNHSTGKMGYALAEAARDMGADVTLVSGPVALDAPANVRIDRVTTAQDMFEAVSSHFPQADLTIMAAAVGDFRPASAASEKIKKHGRTTLELELVSNPDILAWAGEHKRTDGSQAICGFAMETQHLIENAAKKLLEKHCDMLVANNLREPGAGFATDTNVVTILTPTDEQTADIEQLDRMPKRDLAKVILNRLNALRVGSHADSHADSKVPAEA
ncbi:bifunctional phosphopantothenoylcysteine decarboxylase/phosphopantothenate synthase [Bifidobacterium simiarum]|uniref:Coenzyme A biosynthesis bifunctional protein CoaBC n=1 Tax=Bifidobacterium simiarum TaxID=2045441 RepID=A0A2M9HFE7_9BIFI|nr:bifunctional phosphopantothenoylcysteine decarboxylase/phosphopantothenate synthase [Bifidobacterium simiarum]PJM75539.1 phosphopantothenoylcysteine decarboxylase [Bifidobacterium simiarum]